MGLLLWSVGCASSEAVPPLVIEPPEPRTDATLALRFSSPRVTLGGAPPAYRIEWQRDGVSEPDLVRLEVPAERTARGEVWTAQVFEEGVAAPLTASVTIQNTAPRGVGVVVVPVEGDVLWDDVDARCVPAGFSDLDGDAPGWQYAWTVDGAMVAEAVEDRLPASAFAPEQTVGCIATPDDGTDYGEPLHSDPVAVVAVPTGSENAAPQIGAVTFVPAAPRRYETLRAEVEVSDADGDPFTVQVAWSEGAGASTVLDAASGYIVQGGRGTTVLAQISACDEGGRCASEPASLVVANTVPAGGTAAVFADDGGPLRTGVDAWCVVGEASDADGDEVTWTYAWSVGDSVPPVTSETLGATYFGLGDEVRCFATPGDAYGAGEAVSSPAVKVGDPETVAPPKALDIRFDPPAPTAWDEAVMVSKVDWDSEHPDAVVHYAWQVDGVPTEASGTVLPGPLVRGQQLRVEVWSCVGDVCSARLDHTVVVGNALPDLVDVDIVGEEDTSAPVELLAFDPDGDSIKFYVDTDPQHGSLLFDEDPDGGGIIGEVAASHADSDPSSGLLVYAPDANFNGTDSFSVFASDGSGSSPVLEVPVLVGAVNDAPVAVDTTIVWPAAVEDAEPQAYGIDAQFSGAFDDSADDQSALGGSTADAFVGVAVAGFTPRPAAGRWEYRDIGSEDWNELDHAYDGDPMLLLAASAELRFVPAADPTVEPPPLSLRWVEGASEPASGTEVAPPAAWAGSAYSEVVAVSVDVAPRNDPPVIGSEPVVLDVTALEDAPCVLLPFEALAEVLPISDPDSEAGSYRFVDIPSWDPSGIVYSAPDCTGPEASSDDALSLETPFSFAPGTDVNGVVDLGLVEAFDGQDVSVHQVSVSLHLLPVNDAPEWTSTPGPFSVTAGTTLLVPHAQLLPHVSDVDGDALTFVVSAVHNGSVTIGGVTVGAGASTTALPEVDTATPLRWTIVGAAPGGVTKAFTLHVTDGSASSTEARDITVEVLSASAECPSFAGYTVLSSTSTGPVAP